MIKVHNKSDAVVQVKTDVDTYSVMPRANADIEGSKIVEAPDCIQVLEAPKAAK